MFNQPFLIELKSYSKLSVGKGKFKRIRFWLGFVEIMHVTVPKQFHQTKTSFIYNLAPSICRIQFVNRIQREQGIKAVDIWFFSLPLFAFHEATVMKLCFVSFKKKFIGRFLLTIPNLNRYLSSWWPALFLPSRITVHLPTTQKVTQFVNNRLEMLIIKLPVLLTLLPLDTIIRQLVLQHQFNPLIKSFLWVAV